jgi:hypothetical protein
MSNLLEVAQLAQSYQQQYELGQLSAADFKELINDLNVIGKMNENASALERNQDIYQILTAAIQLAESLS